MRIRVINFVADMAKAERFYEALGLRADVRSRTGVWVELLASGGELDLHDSASAADGEGRDGFALNFVADEPLEAVARRLRRQGFPPTERSSTRSGDGRCSCERRMERSSRSIGKSPSSTHDRSGATGESNRRRLRWPPSACATSSTTSTQRSTSTAGGSASREVMHPAPTFAMLSRGDLRLALSAPSGPGGGGQAMPDGTMPEPGGWNRFSLEVADLAATVEELRDGRSPIPQRHRHRCGRQADPARGSLGQSGRAVRTDPARSLIVGSHVTRDRCVLQVGLNATAPTCGFSQAL